MREELLSDEDRRQVVDVGGGVDRFLRGLGQLTPYQHTRSVDHKIDAAGLVEHLLSDLGNIGSLFDVGAGGGS